MRIENGCHDDEPIGESVNTDTLSGFTESRAILLLKAHFGTFLDKLMRQVVSSALAVLLLALVCVVAGCSGSNTPHVLQSISITPASASGAAASFTAIGSFTGSPATVSPLPVSWLLMGPGIDPPPASYSLVDGSYIANHCVQTTNRSPLNYTVIALTPTDLNAPNTGAVPTQVFADLVIARTTTAEDGFVSATAQFTCQ